MPRIHLGTPETTRPCPFLHQRRLAVVPHSQLLPPPSGRGNGQQAGQWRASLIARQKELEEAQTQLEQEHAEIERDLRRRTDGGRARAHASEVNHKIMEDRQGSPVFARSIQNIAAAAALLKALPVARTLEEQRAREKMCKHLHLVADQKAENSASCRRYDQVQRPDLAASEMKDAPASWDRGRQPGHHGASGARGSPSRRGGLRDGGPQ